MVSWRKDGWRRHHGRTARVSAAVPAWLLAAHRPLRLTANDSSTGRAARPAARATAGRGASAAASARGMEPDGRPLRGPPLLRGKARALAAEAPQAPGFPADPRGRRGSRRRAHFRQRARHCSTRPRVPRSLPPRNSKAGWRPGGPAGRRGWRRLVTPWVRARFGERIPTMHPSRRGSSQGMLPLDSAPRAPHLAAHLMAEIHTADLSSLDTDALKSRLTQLGRYL